MDPNLVRQTKPKMYNDRMRGSNFRNPQLGCSKAVAAQAVPTNWGGTDPREPVFDAKMVLELAPKQHVQHGIRLQAVYDRIIV